MNALLTYAALAFAAIPALVQNSSTPPPLLHTETSFDLLVHASYADTTPLFGPEGERPWAGKHWDPQFIYPQPAKDVQGAVFTIQHGPITAVWVNTTFDNDARHFQYVYFLPEIMVTVIDVNFKIVDAKTTAVHLVYARTATTAAGNEHVTAMTEGDKAAGADWQQAIDKYLASSKSPRP
jgi:hypothetical protein